MGLKPQKKLNKSGSNDKIKKGSNNDINNLFLLTFSSEELELLNNLKFTVTLLLKALGNREDVNIAYINSRRK